VAAGPTIAPLPFRGLQREQGIDFVDFSLEAF